MNSFSQLNIETLSTGDSKKDESNTKILSDSDDKIHIFFATQSDLHLTELINPSYYALQELIKGRETKFSNTYKEVTKAIELRGEHPLEMHSILEAIIPKKSDITSKKFKIEPKDIYQIYPTSFIYFLHAGTTTKDITYEEFRKQYGVIKNPYYKVMQSSTSINQTKERYYYLPLCIPEGKAKKGRMELDKTLLPTVNPQDIANIINAGLKNGEYNIGRTPIETLEIISSSGYENLKTNSIGFVLIKLSVPNSENIGFSGLLTIKKNTRVTEYDIVEIGSFQKLEKKPPRLKESTLNNLKKLVQEVKKNTTGISIFNKNKEERLPDREINLSIVVKRTP